MINGLALALTLLAPPDDPAPPAETPPISVEAPSAEAPPSEPAPSEPVRDPAQVQADVEQGRGDVPTPEQVRETVDARGGDPFAPPPNPQARPSEGVYAVGSGAVAPLPAPPPPVPTTTLPRFDWRGVGWLAVRLTFTGPIGGTLPARATAVSLGGGLEAGWRINQVAGLGIGFSRQPHEVSRQELTPTPVIRRGYMTAWDVAFVRVFVPVRGRVDPFVDVGGGVAFLEPALSRFTEVGATVRASAGFDAWLTRNLTLGLAGIYRANFIDDSIGHSLQGSIELAVHW